MTNATTINTNAITTHIRDTYGYEIRAFGRRNPSVRVQAAIVQDTVSNVARDLSLLDADQGELHSVVAAEVLSLLG